MGRTVLRYMHESLNRLLEKDLRQRAGANKSEFTNTSPKLEIARYFQQCSCCRAMGMVRAKEKADA